MDTDNPETPGKPSFLYDNYYIIRLLGYELS